MPASAAKTIGLSSGTTGTYGSTGTIVRQLYGITDASLKIVSKNEVPAVIGWAGPGPISGEVQQSAEGSFSGVGIYEEMPKILNGLFTGIEDTTAAAPPNYYPYLAPTQTSQASYPYTVEYGTSGAVYRVNGAKFTDLSLKGEAGGFWQMSVGLVGKQVIAGTTGVFSTDAREVHPIRTADTSLFIDSWGGTIGNTAVSATLIGFELSYKSGSHTKSFVGSLTPEDWGVGRADVTLKLTAEFNASAKAIVDELLGPTGSAVKRLIRIKATEETSAHQAIIDFAGIKVDGETLFGDRDGNMTVDLSWQGVYSTAMAPSYTTAVGNALNICIVSTSTSTT